MQVRRSLTLGIPAALLGAGLTGCPAQEVDVIPVDPAPVPTAQVQPADPPTAIEVEPPAAEVDAVAPEEVEVVTITTAQELKEGVAAIDADYVVLNFWATWCSPCVAEFPDLVAATRAFRGQGVVLATASLDFPAELDEKVKPFLADHGAPENAFLVDAGDHDEFITAFHDPWSGEIPATFVFDREGNILGFYPGEHTLQEFKAAIEEHVPAA